MTQPKFFIPTGAWNIRAGISGQQVIVAAPELGQHTEDVLLEAGYSWEEIEALRTDGAIGVRHEK